MISVPDNPSRNGKLYPSGKDALEGISIGDTVLVAGFARCGIPQKLLQALSEIEVSELTLICQGAWVQESTDFTVADLVATGKIKKIISPMPFHPVYGG